MRLYNTLTRELEELVPDEVRAGARPFGMYSCGPTVQDAPHFGHARAALVPDVLRRYLEWTGVAVLHVRNITDVDDKIIERAAREGRSAAAVAEHYARVYEAQMGRLGVLPPHIVPRATGHILEMLALVEQLLERGAAYVVDGDVYFRVRAFPRYGRLSGRNVDELRAGARVEADERKDDPVDFALWKAAKPGEPSWPSPWGPGRPGWHIECSAMAEKHLGRGFDLHAGGMDLVFPHHENEIAQAEAASGEPFARVWMHNGLLSLGAEKMSKSLGNVIALSDALDRYGAPVLRLYYLRAHYRSDIVFGEDRLDDAAAALERWRALVRATAGAGPADPEAAGNGAVAAADAEERFRAAMDDDLGTPAAVAALFDLVQRGNVLLAEGRQGAAAVAAAALVRLADVLGIDLAAPGGGTDADVGALVGLLLEERQAARARRDFEAADRIRDRLAAAGIAVEDTPSGARWHRRTPAGTAAP